MNDKPVVYAEFASKLELQRDEWKEVAANAERAIQRAKRERDEFAKRLEDALSDKVIAEAQIAALQDKALAEVGENATIQRLRQQLAEGNSAYLKVMTERDELRKTQLDSTQIATLIHQAEKYEKLKETIRIFVE